MNPLLRWCRFNVVGVMGMGVQLAVLAAVNRFAPAHYLLATAVAIEAALLHNFIWHTLYTWRDRAGGRTLQSAIRFHLSNGAISMLGNLVIMRLLVGGLRIRPLAANVVAIACCSIANFTAGNLWAFEPPPH